MDGAAANGHFHVVEWLHRNRSEGCTKSATDGAIRNDHTYLGHLDAVKWLHRNRPEGWTSAAMASNGHLEVVKYLHTNLKQQATNAAAALTDRGVSPRKPI
ncbi:hypothetical protein PC129_g7906 [Phytophthora cactorum]|uniref:Ankyrin repeat-containing domain n=1 Tax=Phytophthora cactorum TaxID=29920 RepID=A0A8T1IC45_9STRA|nr:hypothetical protein PC129_g7906 [Phytophthora cactorum]